MPATTEPTEPVAEEETVSLSGAVVHVNPVAESFALATADGRLAAVHAEDLPAPGRKLKLTATQLFNGTYSVEGEAKEKGEVQEASFGGIVTYVDSDTGGYTVSGRGVSVFVHVAEGPSLMPPPLGSEVEVGARVGRFADLAPITPGEDTPLAVPADCEPPTEPQPAPEMALTQVSVDVVDPFVGDGFAEGIVRSKCPDSNQLLLTADDVGESAEDILVTMDEQVQLYVFESGQAVSLSIKIAEDGTYTAIGSSIDDGATGADDPNGAQGDQSFGVLRRADRKPRNGSQR